MCLSSSASNFYNYPSFPYPSSWTNSATSFASPFSDVTSATQSNNFSFLQRSPWMSGSWMADIDQSESRSSQTKEPDFYSIKDERIAEKIKSTLTSSSVTSSPVTSFNSSLSHLSGLSYASNMMTPLPSLECFKPEARNTDGLWKISAHSTPDSILPLPKFPYCYYN